MSDFTALLALIVLILIVWFWADSLRARECALRVCAKACQEINAQLLDETVALRRVSLARNEYGRAVLRRTYRFEYSLDRTHRLRGSVIMRGRAVETVAIQSPDGRTQFEQDKPH
jgi:hypothetical protein